MRHVGRDLEDFIVERHALASPVSPAAVRYTGDMIFGTPFTVMSDFPPSIGEHDKQEALKQFHGIETLVVNGMQDLLTPPDHSEAIVRLVPGAEHVVINEAGHIIMLEHPEVITGLFLSLVERGCGRPRRASTSSASRGCAARSPTSPSAAAWPRHATRAAMPPEGLRPGRARRPSRSGPPPRRTPGLGCRLGGVLGPATSSC